jgi:hypothetical protein
MKLAHFYAKVSQFLKGKGLQIFRFSANLRTTEQYRMINQPPSPLTLPQDRCKLISAYSKFSLGRGGNEDHIHSAYFLIDSIGLF